MTYLPALERKLEKPMKNLQNCLEYLKVLQLLASSHPEPSVSLLTAHLEYIQDTLNSTSVELGEIQKTL